MHHHLQEQNQTDRHTFQIKEPTMSVRDVIKNNKGPMTEDLLDSLETIVLFLYTNTCVHANEKY